MKKLKHIKEYNEYENIQNDELYQKVTLEELEKFVSKNCEVSFKFDEYNPILILGENNKRKLSVVKKAIDKLGLESKVIHTCQIDIEDIDIDDSDVIVFDEIERANTYVLSRIAHIIFEEEPSKMIILLSTKVPEIHSVLRNKMTIFLVE